MHIIHEKVVSKVMSLHGDGLSCMEEDNFSVILIKVGGTADHNL